MNKHEIKEVQESMSSNNDVEVKRPKSLVQEALNRGLIKRKTTPKWVNNVVRKTGKEIILLDRNPDIVKDDKVVMLANIILELHNKIDAIEYDNDQQRKVEQLALVSYTMEHYGAVIKACESYSAIPMGRYLSAYIMNAIKAFQEKSKKAYDEYRERMKNEPTILSEVLTDIKDKDVAENETKKEGSE